MGWGGVCCDYPWGMQPDAMEHQELQLINKGASTAAFAGLSLMLIISHSHTETSLGVTSGTC